MSAVGDRRRPRGASGFTLLEMLVALGILSLITGLAFPAVQRMTARQQAAAARGTILLALAQARAAAIGGDRAVTLALSPDRRSLVSSATAPLAVPAALGLSWPARGIGFYSDGTALGGTATIGMTGEASVHIAVDGPTGRIAVSQ